MKQKEAAVIILNYNSSNETNNLIASIQKNEQSYYLIVVDNNSEKKDRENLQGLSKVAELIFLDDNLGYAAGNNIGIKRAMELGYDYFLIANSDIEIIHKNTIGSMVLWLEKMHAAAVGPQMLDADGKLDSGIVIDDKMGRTKRIPVASVTACRSLVGACLLLSREMIEKNGYLPEEYFLYREETDYLVRANEKGLKIYYVPEIEIIHRHGATTGRVWDYYFNRNTIYFAKKIWRTNSAELYVFHFLKSIYISLCILIGKQKRSYKGRAIFFTWLGLIDGIRGKQGKCLRLNL